jgi:16S rRNA pseudouridine516 synthase
MRLDKFLCDCHVGTRKDVKKLIKDGKVKVDGTLAKSFDMKIDEEKSVVTLNGEKVVYEKYVYFMMNKPQGYISATEDKYKNTVLNLLSDEYKNYNLFPAGRLDIDTEGFLLLTDDGVFAHNILSPKKHVSKTYFALIDGKVKDEHIKMFEDGITLEDGYKTLPAKLKILKSSDKSEIELTIYEGKFHQVKRMFEAIGSHVTYLKRIAMGNLFLDEKLPLGEIKKLNKDDILKIEADRYKGE